MMAETITAESYRELWVAVVLQAVKDVAHLAHGTNKDLAAHQARQWVGSRDFNLVCDMAGLDSQSVAERIRALIAREDQVPMRERALNRNAHSLKAMQ